MESSKYQELKERAFKIDNEVVFYTPQTGIYPASNPWRSIETQIYLIQIVILL